MTFGTATVRVVDDDADLRESMRWMLTQAGYTVNLFASAETFMEGWDPDQPGCALVDIRMPGMNGLELQRWMAAQPRTLPVIIVTAHADVPAAVQAIQAGALDFVQKPCPRQALLGAIERAIQRDGEDGAEVSRVADFDARVGQLTAREEEVMRLMAIGLPTKQIARRLGISDRTIEVHRGRVMRKMKVGSIASLAVMVATDGMQEPTAAEESAAV